MFTTTEQVQALTGYEGVPVETIHTAQMLMEAYTGRTEAEVTATHDLAVLAKATAYQAAYLVHNSQLVFEQMGATQIMQGGQMISFPQHGLFPYLAPLAVMTCERLSWKRIRSIRTGTIYHEPPTVDGWERS